MITTRTVLLAASMAALAASAPAQRAKPRGTATPPAPTQTPLVPTQTPAGIDRAKFEKVYRAGKVLLQSASWAQTSSVYSVRSAKREFDDAMKAFELETSIARDLASTPAEKDLALAYGDAETVGSEIAISLSAADAIRQLSGSQLDLKQRQENNSAYGKLKAEMEAAEDLYLGRRVPTVPQEAPTPPPPQGTRDKSGKIAIIEKNFEGPAHCVFITTVDPSGCAPEESSRSCMASKVAAAGGNLLFIDGAGSGSAFSCETLPPEAK